MPEWQRAPSCVLTAGWRSQPDPTGESSMTTAKLLARYSAIWGALERLRYRRTTTRDAISGGSASGRQALMLPRSPSALRID
jgi:hypothetical protein